MKHVVAWAVMASTMTSVAGCGGDEVPTAETYQGCFDDQPDADTPTDRIIACCLDYQIGGVRYTCGTTVADCINYLTANLSQISADVPEVRDGCEQYVDLRPSTPQ